MLKESKDLNELARAVTALPPKSWSHGVATYLCNNNPDSYGMDITTNSGISLFKLIDKRTNEVLINWTEY